MQQTDREAFQNNLFTESVIISPLRLLPGIFTWNFVKKKVIDTYEKDKIEKIIFFSFSWFGIYIHLPLLANIFSTAGDFCSSW